MPALMEMFVEPLDPALAEARTDIGNQKKEIDERKGIFHSLSGLVVFN